MPRFLTLTLIVIFAGLMVPAQSGAASSLLAPQAHPGQNAARLQRLLDDLAEQRSQVIAIQRELVARPALRPEHGGRGEEAKAIWIQRWLAERDIPAERLDSPDLDIPLEAAIGAPGVRPNLIIHYPGLSPRTLWLVCHLDVGPPGDPSLWTSSPWELRVDGDLIFGRGVSDNHQGLVSAMLLLDSLHRLEVRPPLTIGFLALADEKAGSRHGFFHVLAERPDLFQPGDFILVPDVGTPDGLGIELGEKGQLQFQITVRGRESFSSMPDLGRNAVEIGALLITVISRELPPLFPGREELFTPPTSTFVTTQVEATTGLFYQISDRFSFTIDCRLLPGDDPETLKTALNRLAGEIAAAHGVTVEIKPLGQLPPAPISNRDSPVALALGRAVRTQMGRPERYFGIGGMTISSLIRARGHQAVGWSIQANLGGTGNEQASIRAHLDQAQVFARLLFDDAMAAAPAEAPEPAEAGRD